MCSQRVDEGRLDGGCRALVHHIASHVAILHMSCNALENIRPFDPTSAVQPRPPRTSPPQALCASMSSAAPGRVTPKLFHELFTGIPAAKK